jgi:death-on-curing protein
LQSSFLSKRLVLAIHRDQINSFGGTHGLRDEGLLESALEQPKMTYGGELLHPTLLEQAAAYLFHLAQNHPFVDGNKRVAFAAMDVFLRINGVQLELSDAQAYRLVVGAASGKTTKEQIADLLRENTPQ